VQVIAIILFFLVGVAFGYALGPPMMWVPVIFPLVMALAAALKDGPSGSIVLRLVIALVVTVGGVLLGQRLAPERRPEEAPG
jgi:hypothetical protein